MIFKTYCYYCGKNIKISVPFKFRRYRVHGAFTCNQCVPENHYCRNGQDEAFFTERKVCAKKNKKERNLKNLKATGRFYEQVVLSPDTLIVAQGHMELLNGEIAIPLEILD